METVPQMVKASGETRRNFLLEDDGDEMTVAIGAYIDNLTDEQRAFVATRLTIGPRADTIPLGLDCPPWCKGRHEIDMPGLLGEHATRDFSTQDIASVSLVQSFASENGALKINPVHIYADVDGADMSLTADQARAFAIALTGAADQLDEIVGGGQ